MEMGRIGPAYPVAGGKDRYPTIQYIVEVREGIPFSFYEMVLSDD
jgi:hypothetical protein